MRWFKLNRLLLLVLPVFLVVISFIQQSERTNYHMYETDPEYSYLFNGMNILNLASPAHVQGPGTPSQLAAAFVIKVVYTFRSTPDKLNVDVMKNPDVYCKAINTFTFFLLAFSLLFAGFAVSFSTKSLIAGVFLQLIPFTKWVLLDLNSRIFVECMVTIGVVLLIPVVLMYINDRDTKNRIWSNRYIITISILIGFIASSKLVYVPIALVPFFVIKGAKCRTAYVLYSILAFFLISFPIWFYWSPFKDWYLINFFNSGMYGSGQATIIDPGIFKANMREIFLNDPFYLITFLATALTVFLSLIPSLKLRKQKDNEFLVLLGIFLTFIVLTLVVSKQLKNYYLVVNFLLMIPAWYFIVMIFSQKFNPFFFRITKLVVFILIAVVVYRNGPKLVFDYHQIRMDKDEAFRESLLFVEESFTPEMPVLALPNYFGAPFKEYGIFYGMAWCGNKMGTKYAVDLNVLYPHIYFFHNWNKRFNQWGTSYSFIGLLQKYGSVTFYSGDQTWEESLNDKFRGINRQVDTHWELNKSFDQLGQYFYTLTYNPLSDSIGMYMCDAERIDSSGRYFLNNLGQKFEGAAFQSIDFYRSGANSLKLQNDQYGFTCALSEVQMGDEFFIEVWRKIGNDNSALVVQATNSDEFYISKSVSVETDGQWEKLVIKLLISEALHNKDLRVYCWNYDSDKPSYFDDFCIVRLLD